MSKEIRPDSPHVEYTAAASKWQRCRDTFAGTDAVKGQREVYLPKLDVHLRGTRADERYNSFLRRAYFFNAVKRTVIGLSGLIHQTAPTVKAPEEAQTWLDDVTLTGISAQLQSLLTTEETILVGRSGLLVDTTSGKDPRPFWVPVKAENIVNWRLNYVDGKPVLSMVVLRECYYQADPEDPFSSTEKERYRVLLLTDGFYNQIVWEKDDKGKWSQGPAIFPQRRGAPLTFIPFIFIGPTSSDPKVEDPPALDLVDLNISHYQTTASLEHGLGYLGAPSLVLIGVGQTKDGKPVEYGASSAISVPMGGDAKILQADGERMGALERAEERKRNLLSVMGARLLEAPPGTQETATAVSMRHSGEHATLRTIAQSVERGFTFALKVSLWWGATTAATPADVDANFELNKDFFSTTLGSEEIKALLGLVQAGTISFETFWHEFVEGGHGRPGVTAEEEQAQIEAEGGKMEEMPNASQPPVVVGNPYEVKQLNGDWVVTKKGTDEIVPGGKHGKDRAAALKHFATLEAGYHKKEK